MQRALIATVFNEADNIVRWWDCLMRQTVKPDEIVIVDGGSTDGTWEELQELARQSPVPVKLEQRRCNIAEGRNHAIRLTDAEIIASTDAGCSPEAGWFGEITRPLLENAAIDIVGGNNVPLCQNDFQKFVKQLDGNPAEPLMEGPHGSGRNTAYRRTLWADVGGYPEWLTLTAEDSLFNCEWYAAGKKFFYQRSAVVHWPVRETAAAYFKMLYHYGYGAGEARQESSYFLRRLVIVLFPPLLLLSRHRFAFLKFRYRRNAASVRGWLVGRFHGRRPPPGWRRANKVYLSPETQSYLAQKANSI
ncbi:MAG TPA: glycosyltransferase [Candidatus Acidoferrales bacterium]|jgi:glycosyltransferase involved in cell wall biosynthesis|nr:glycosyltransferase [Candidatus Acidoferrales bacterium]